MAALDIESLDHEGRGVGHYGGKVIFVDGALSGERVDYASYRCKSRYELAEATQVLQASSQRVRPECEHFGHCGGCSVQHLAARGQMAAKQRVLEDALWHLARLRPEQILPPIAGADWGYRVRARLSIRFVPGKGGILVGFHEKRSSYVALMDRCPVMSPRVSALIPVLKELLAGMSIKNRLPQIEIADGEAHLALVLRHLEPLTKTDQDRLRRFADQQGIVWYLQPGGPETATVFHPADTPLPCYTLPDYDLRLNFGPTEFTQVNQGVNRLLIRRAMNLLAPRPGDRIADMFCGLGNFSLPLARLGAQVVGIEGSPALVARATENAHLNDLSSSCNFRVADLFKAPETILQAIGPIDKMLIDPPRDGAQALVKSLGDQAPARLVYVSCQPSTLARDAAILVHEKGYRLYSAGIANMFPQTSHVESIALFQRG